MICHLLTLISGLAFCSMMASILLSTKNNAEASTGGVAFFFLYMLISGRCSYSHSCVSNWLTIHLAGATINVVPWVYGPEVLPLQARTRGVAISISSRWTWNFWVVMMTPILIGRLEWKTYLIFMATNASFVPIVYFLYPETSKIS